MVSTTVVPILHQAHCRHYHADPRVRVDLRRHRGFCRCSVGLCIDRRGRYATSTTGTTAAEAPPRRPQAPMSPPDRESVVIRLGEARCAGTPVASVAHPATVYSPTPMSPRRHHSRTSAPGTRSSRDAHDDQGCARSPTSAQPRPAQRHSPLLQYQSESDRHRPARHPGRIRCIGFRIRSSLVLKI